MLSLDGIDSIVIERQSRAHVLARIRAGVLEDGTVQLLRAVGLGKRMDVEGKPHDGTVIAWQDRSPFLIDTKKYTGRRMMAYGQTAITADLYSALDARGGRFTDAAQEGRLHNIAPATPPGPFTPQETNNPTPSRCMAWGDSL